MHWIDPDTLPETHGTIAALIHNPGGELDGFVLDIPNEGDRLVHLPPHFAARIARRAKPGRAISVWGIKPRDADMLVAVAVQIDGRREIDDGPEGHEPPPPPTTRPVDVTGSVRLTLHAPHGEVCGALLHDGTVVRVHPEGNAALADYFEPGRSIEVWGEAFRKNGARVVDVQHVAYLAESEDEAQGFADEAH